MKDEVVATRRKKLAKWIDLHHGGIQADFINATGINQGELSGLLKEKSFGERKARKLEEQAGMPRMWLDSDENNIEPTADIQPPIPIISWVAAGSFTCMTEQVLPSVQDRESWAYTTRKHSPNSFGLKVRGESMFNPGGKVSFQEGEIVLVDPEMDPRNGDFVVVRLDNQDEATFKKLVIEGGEQYLMALNPDWPERIIELDESATIIGVVFEKVVRFR